MGNLLLNADQAAAELETSRATVFRLVQQGKLASIKVGRLRRFTPAQLREYIEREQENQAVDDG